MLAVVSFVSDLATGTGLLAGVIAIGGFLAHARPVLSGAPEPEIREATVRGGLIGLLIGSLVIVLSAFLGKVVV
jgi:hypothetical protein